MRKPEPCTLEIARVRLEPMTLEHADALGAAARDGELWQLHVTSVPAPHEAGAYIAAAMQGYADGHMLPFVVRDLADGTVVGSTRYHDIVPEVERLEIGYTSCKLLLMTHAFETLGARLVGWRTDHENFASQQAIERLGARKDGVLRRHALRRDGTVRDTVMYSMTADEWPAVKGRLTGMLSRGSPASAAP